MMSFNKKNILVVGDLLLDQYFIGNVNRISPEAPVPVIKLKKNKFSLGGSGNVSKNISSLESDVGLISLIGKDENGKTIKKLLKEANIKNLVLEINQKTTVKLRVIGDTQQIVRLDIEDSYKLTRKIENNIIKLFESNLPNYDIVILSDYAKGLLSEKLCKKLIKIAVDFKKPIFIDPKQKNWRRYSHASLIKPNFKEFCEAINKNLENTHENIEKYAPQLIKKYNIEAMLITRSEKGMSFINKNTISHFSTDSQEVFDVTGAGDTVIATLALGIANHFSYQDAIKISNKAAGIAVSKQGTTSLTKKELFNNLSHIFTEDTKNDLFNQINLEKTKFIKLKKGYNEISNLQDFEKLKKTYETIVICYEKELKSEYTDQVIYIKHIDYVLYLDENSINKLL